MSEQSMLQSLVAAEQARVAVQQAPKAGPQMAPASNSALSTGVVAPAMAGQFTAGNVTQFQQGAQFTDPAASTTNLVQDPQANQNLPPWLPGRLEEAKNAALKQFMERYGLAKEDDLKAKLNKLTELEQASLTQQERTQKELEALRVQAAEAARYRDMSSVLADLQYSQLPQHEQAVLASLQPLDRIPYIQMFQQARAAAQAAGVQQPPTAPQVAPSAPVLPGTVGVDPAAVAAILSQATTPGVSQQPVGVMPLMAVRPANNAPPAPPSPAPSTTTAFDTWQRMQAENPVFGAMFYRKNVRDIEASRPSGAA